MRLCDHQLQRDVEMRLQLGIRDKEGMTVAMHAARTQNIAIFALVVHEIEQTGVSMQCGCYLPVVPFSPADCCGVILCICGAPSLSLCEAYVASWQI